MKKLNKNTARAVVRRAVDRYGLNHAFYDLPVYIDHGDYSYSVRWSATSQAYVVMRRCDSACNLVNDGLF